MICPWRRTMIRSAALTVDSRWAIKIEVVSARMRETASWICDSVKGSILAGASARVEIAGGCHEARRREEGWALPHRQRAAAFADLGLQPGGKRVDPLAPA